MKREDKIREAIRGRGFHEKAREAFVSYVFRPRTAVALAGTLAAVGYATGSWRAAGLAALTLGLGLAAAYALWFASMYFLAYVWTKIVRWVKKAGP